MLLFEKFSSKSVLTDKLNILFISAPKSKQNSLILNIPNITYYPIVGVSRFSRISEPAQVSLTCYVSYPKEAREQLFSAVSHVCAIEVFTSQICQSIRLVPRVPIEIVFIQGLLNSFPLRTTNNAIQKKSWKITFEMLEKEKDFFDSFQIQSTFKK